MESKLKEMANLAGLETLPDEVSAWTQVLLSAGKAFIDFYDDFAFRTDNFITAAGPGKCGPAPGGLLYINVFGDHDSVLFHIIDAGGQLASVYGEGVPGGVWFAETWCEIWNDESDSTLSIDVWRAVKARKDPSDGSFCVCTAP